MRKRISLMLVLAMLLAMILPMSVSAVEVAGIKITGDVATEKTFTIDELKAMKTITATYKALNSSGTVSETEFTGVELQSLLDACGVKAGATKITFIASDGYKSEKDFSMVGAKYLGDLKVIITWSDTGEFQVVVPQKTEDDKNKGSWARQLVEINISGAPAAGDDDVAASTGAFTDVADNHPAAGYISDIFNRGITTGDTATTFGPDKTLTRAQFVTFLGRLADVKASKFEEGPFGDIKGAGVDYAIGYINWAFSTNITTGVSATAFAPSDKVTRQQVATFVYRYAQATSTQLNGPALQIKDFSDVASWAADAVPLVVHSGLMSLSDGKFRPNDYCTRAEMAQVLSLFPAITIGEKSYTMAELAAMTGVVKGEYKFGEGTKTGYAIGVKLGDLIKGVADDTEILVQTSDNYPKGGTKFKASEVKDFIVAYKIGTAETDAVSVTQPYLITGTEQLKYVNRISVGGVLGSGMTK